MIAWDVEKLKVELLPEGSVSAFPLKRKHDWLVTTGDGLERTALFVSESAQDRLVDFPWLARGMDGTRVCIVEPVNLMLEIAILEFGSAE